MGRFAWIAALVAFLPGLAAAQDCTPSDYVVGADDTILTIAETHYGDAEKWTLIYYANQDLLQSRGFNVAPGDALVLPCAPGQAAQKADATPLKRPDAEMVLVTGSNFAPFTDQDWPGKGMVTEVVNAALESTPAPVPYAIVWEDDWSRHLFPILREKQADMGFPWYKPDCASTPENERCANFHFSDPLVEVLIMLFVRQGDGFVFESDADVLGKTLCRPKGYFTHDLDRAGRRWLSEDLITLVQADTPQACFEALQRGDVDAVTVNVFLGANTIDDMGLRGQVVPLERPLSSEGLHVVISKTHWRGTTHLYRINAGIAALKESDRYNEIVSRHLAVFWDRMKTGTN